MRIIINMIFILLTFLMINLGLAWYGYSKDFFKFNSNEGEVVLSSNCYLAITTNLKCNYLLEKNVDGIYCKKTYKPYCGEDGVNQSYILLYESSEGFSGVDDTIYVKSLSITKPQTINISYASDETNDFSIVVLKEENELYYPVEVVDGELYFAFALIFGNGITPFRFSDNLYLGTNFSLVINYNDK